MGTTARHIKVIVPTTAAQRHTVLHHDVTTHQQPICQETRCREEAPPHNPRCGAGGACGLGLLVTSTVPLGAAHAATIENPPVLLKKPLPIRICRCHLPSPPLWGPGAVPGDWTDVCGFLKPPDSHEKWIVRLRGAFSISHSTLGFREKDQSCHHEVWMHLALANPRQEYAPRDRRDQRPHANKRSAPYQRNKGRSRAHGEQSNHPHLS